MTACFNPRPPFPGGDAQIPENVFVDGDVSIHAPRFREAMQVAAHGVVPPRMFQSTPPVSGRRCF